MEDKIVTLGRQAAWCELMAAKCSVDDYEGRMYQARARLYRDRQVVELDRQNAVLHLTRRALRAT